jgi:YebC/PmpR family DNA-binding regulatory protein
MAGHNKWSKVKRWKGALDAKRGKIFSKLAREVAMTAREGGPDPDMNPRLRMVLLKCKQANMPADNVERAIKKGTGGDDSTHYEELQYEIYGPHGIAMLVDLTTDNRNRTAAELRSLVSKRAGTIATPGAVSRLFQRKGQILYFKHS